MADHVDPGLIEKLELIELPVTRLAKRVLKQMVRQSLERGEGEFLMITGPAGSGKSHLSRQLLRYAAELCKTSGRARSCMRLILAAAGNLKDLSRQLAREIGNPVTMRKLMDLSQKDLSLEVFEDLRRLGFVVLIFDEAHNLLFNKFNDEGLALALWLKNLTYLGICIVFLGEPQLAEIFPRYPAMTGRLYRPNPIQTTQLSASSREDIEIALNFLAEVQSAYGVDATPPFSHRDVALPLLAAARAEHRVIARLIQGAVTHYTEREGKSVILEDFAASALDAGLQWIAA